MAGPKCDEVQSRALHCAYNSFLPNHIAGRVMYK
jgi:hypothetical protein